MNKKWFTIVELVVTMTIIVILSSISFITFSEYQVNARNTVRKSDLANLEMALEKEIKEWRNLFYWQYQYWWENNFRAELGENFKLNHIRNIPKDPKTNTYYIIWATNSSYEPQYQLATTIEWKVETSYVTWNYSPILTSLPSLIYVGNYNQPLIPIEDAVLNGSSANLYYTTKWNFEPKNDKVTNDEIYKAFRHNYKSCEEIKNKIKINTTDGSEVYLFAPWNTLSNKYWYKTETCN